MFKNKVNCFNGLPCLADDGWGTSTYLMLGTSDPSACAAPRSICGSTAMTRPFGACAGQADGVTRISPYPFGRRTGIAALPFLKPHARLLLATCSQVAHHTRRLAIPA